MKYGIIYLIENKINGKKYIGQTTRSLEQRFADHCTEKRNRHISNAIIRYGKDNFSIKEICTCSSQEDLNEKEIYFVETFNTMYPIGYNHRAGGNQNGKCSDLLREKISKAKTGKPNLKRRGEIRSEEQRMKISKGLGGHKVKARNLDTGEIVIYNTVHDTKKDGHNPSNVVSICKKYGRRYHSKRWTFEYIIDANQSGSSDSKEFEHAQRIEIETEKSD